jgi:hypothetical protein
MDSTINHYQLTFYWALKSSVGLKDDITAMF